MDRFIHLFGKDGQILAALNSLSSGDTTLYIGDAHSLTRIILGALVSEIDSDEPTNDWGLVFRKPGSTQPLFNILVKSTKDATESTAALRLVRPNGAEWSVY